MSQKVLLKKSSVLGKIPLATDLSYGELALNYADGKLYFKDSLNNVKSFNSDIQLSINDLVDVDTVTVSPTIGQVLKWNGSNWVPANDETSGGAGSDADTLDGFDSSYFLNYNNLLNTPTIPTLTSQLTNDSGYLTTVNWNDVTNKPTFATVATSGSYTDLINTPTLFSGDYNDLSNKPNLVKAAVQWTPYHTLADGTRYLAGDVVYDNGNVFVANFDNESLPTSNTTYWTDLGAGNRLNIDGRDIPNITYAQLTGKPNVPTSTSELTNDSGYVTGIDLIGYTTETYVTQQLATKQDTLVSGTNIKTINGSSIVGSGDIVISGGAGLYTNSTVTTTTDLNQVIDSFALTQYRTVKYFLQATSSTEVYSSEITVMHNDTTVFKSEFNMMHSGLTALVTIDATINGSDVNLTATPSVAGLTIDVTRIALVTRAFTNGSSPEGDLMSQSGSEDLQSSSGSQDLNV